MEKYRAISGDELTIKEAQRSLPWSKHKLPNALHGYEPRDHMARHALFHAQKAVSKIAEVYESTDHRGKGYTTLDEENEQIQKATADLIAVALHFANLYSFDLQGALERRMAEKNNGAKFKRGE